MDEMVHENAEQIAQLYQQVQRVLDGTNICTSGDIYFFKIHNKIAELSNNTVGQKSLYCVVLSCPAPGESLMMRMLTKGVLRR